MSYQISLLFIIVFSNSKSGKFGNIYKLDTFIFRRRYYFETSQKEIRDNLFETDRVYLNLLIMNPFMQHRCLLLIWIEGSLSGMAIEQV